ncbi:MAG: hypothetical protein Q9181_006609 [Wetmoreana brouardii]
MARFLRLIVFLAIVCCAVAGDTDPYQADRQSDDVFCETYQKCGSKGLQYWNSLHTTLLQPFPSDRTDGLAKFQSSYVIKEADEDTSFSIKRVLQDLVNHGFDIQSLTGWDTWSKDPKTQQVSGRVPPYSNDFDTKSGLLVAHSNYRQFDLQRTLPWSEIIFQSWQIIQTQQEDGGPISNLRTIVRKEVQNPGAKTVLEVLYKSRQLSVNQGDQTWTKWTEEDQAYSFYALLGTDNVKGVVWLLNDHAAAIRKKTIKEIWTRWAERDPDMWIELAPQEQYTQYLTPPSADPMDES